MLHNYFLLVLFKLIELWDQLLVYIYLGSLLQVREVEFVDKGEVFGFFWYCSFSQSSIDLVQNRVLQALGCLSQTFLVVELL